jgi:lipopolysaccharide biosynthesis glycosyltransferase
MSKKSNNKTAFFCCGNESYVNVMISQLSLARTYNDVDCYIISNLKNNDKIQLIKNFDINLINVDLSKSFTTTNKHWPIEAFYYFYAPEELYQRGYEKSVFFDGDVYCANKINLDKLDMKGRDISAVRESKKGDFNAGVIVFDNEKLYKKKVF